MNFTAEEIRQLRYRLGWSQAEMARCLKLTLATVSSVEAGRATLPVEVRSNLLQIMNQAESNAERVQRVPIAEVLMKDLGLSQIHDFEVQSRSTDKN